MVSRGVRELFVDGLERLYGAHHQGGRQAAENIQTSTSPLLKRMLRAGSRANLKQAERLEEVFASLRLTPSRKFDPAMEGIKEANKAAIAETADPAARDLANIGYGQVAAHFYIAQYGTLRSYALALGADEAASLLQKTLNETGKLDVEFTKLAKRLAQRSALPNYGSESALYTRAALHPMTATAAVLGLRKRTAP